MRHILTYNGKSTLDFGVHISGEDTWKTAAPDLERTSIPGRSGDLVSFNKRYKNVEIRYHIGKPSIPCRMRSSSPCAGVRYGQESL